MIIWKLHVRLRLHHWSGLEESEEENHLLKRLTNMSRDQEDSRRDESLTLCTSILERSHQRHRLCVLRAASDHEGLYVTTDKTPLPSLQTSNANFPLEVWLLLSAGEHSLNKEEQRRVREISLHSPGFGKSFSEEPRLSLQQLLHPDGDVRYTAQI